MSYQTPPSLEACPALRTTIYAALLTLTVACGGGGGGSSAADPDPTAAPTPTTSPTPAPGDGGEQPVEGDAARRAVLSDIGSNIVLPALRDFEQQALALQTAVAGLAASPGDATAIASARAAWVAAMASWQRNEVYQVGPAGRSSNPDAVAGGQDFRDLIYSWPFTLDRCGIEGAALNGSAVTAATPVNQVGLGALEYLLYTNGPDADCPDAPTTAQRAAHAARLADRLVVLASALRQRWEPDDGNFLAQWSRAGLDSVTYSAPQDALDALSIALFHVEKVSKDRKTALPTGIPVSGLECSDPVACPEFLESPLSQTSGAHLLVNMRAFRDIFTGVDGSMGINDLLIGVGRQDLADDLITELDLAIDAMEAIEAGAGFDAAVAAIDDSTECVNASSNATGLAPCAFHGLIKNAMDIFRAPIVSALGLAIPQAAAGDND
nr:imelysin family protein [Oceanococcus sp. HetDA_MAG_MS8]